MLNLQLATSEFSVVFAMCLCQITYVANWTRKQFVVSLSDMMIGERGWKFCDPTTGRCYTSRNVVFDEMSS